MITTVDDNNKILQESISNNVNTTLKNFQSTLIKSVNKMTVEQLEIRKINRVKNILDTMIKIQTAQAILTHNNLNQDTVLLKNTQQHNAKNIKRDESLNNNEQHAQSATIRR